jgi:hypothetical protein
MACHFFLIYGINFRAIILVFGIKVRMNQMPKILGFIEGSWQSLMATLDSGTMGGDGKVGI